jgi:hypothetical protein
MDKCVLNARLVDYDAFPGDAILIPLRGVFTARKVSRAGVLFYERHGWVSYFWLKLAGARYSQRK